MANGTAAIVAAGGRGERSGSEVPKQFADLEGRPLFLWSLDRLLAWGCEAIVLVVPPDRIEWARTQLEGAEAVQVVGGGEVRQASVSNGLAGVKTDVVFVHDAARPFVDAGVLDALVAALEQHDAAIPVVPLSETLKETAGDRVVRTVDRARLVLSQTPQAFRTEALRDAHRRAADEAHIGTDDAALVERYGGTVGTVPGSRINIKLTYPEDFTLARAMMRS